MKKLLPILILTLSLGGCANLGQTLSTIGTDLGIVAADLPTACGNLSAALTTIAATPGVPANAQAAITAGVSKYSTYCGPSAQAVTDAAAAIADIQTTVQAIQAIQ